MPGSLKTSEQNRFTLTHTHTHARPRAHAHTQTHTRVDPRSTTHDSPPPLTAPWPGPHAIIQDTQEQGDKITILTTIFPRNRQLMSQRWGEPKHSVEHWEQPSPLRTALPPQHQSSQACHMKRACTSALRTRSIFHVKRSCRPPASQLKAISKA